MKAAAINHGGAGKVGIVGILIIETVGDRITVPNVPLRPEDQFMPGNSREARAVIGRSGRAKDFRIGVGITQIHLNGVGQAAGDIEFHTARLLLSIQNGGVGHIGVGPHHIAPAQLIGRQGNRQALIERAQADAGFKLCADFRVGEQGVVWPLGHIELGIERLPIACEHIEGTGRAPHHAHPGNPFIGRAAFSRIRSLRAGVQRVFVERELGLGITQTQQDFDIPRRVAHQILQVQTPILVNPAQMGKRR